MQSALFYPFTYLYAALAFPAAHALNVLLHSILAGTFAWALARDLGLGRPASSLTGFVYAFNGWIVLHYPFPSNFSACAWLPLAALYLRRAAGGRPRAAIAGAVVLAFQIFAGHPQFVIYTALALLLVALGERRPPRAAAWWAGLLSLGGLLAAVQLVPSLLLIRESGRGAGLPFEAAAAYSCAPFELVRMLLQPLWNRSWAPSGGDPHIVGFYIGVPALLLAAAGLTERPGRPYAAAALLGLLLALGRHLPGYRLLYDHVWPFASMRFPSQALVLSAFGLSVLAGLGLERLTGRRRPLLAAGIVLVCAADLALFARGAVETIGPELYSYSPPAAAFLARSGGLDRFLLSPRSRSLEGTSGPTRLLAWEGFRGALYPNLAMASGVYDADGNEVLRPARYDALLTRAHADPLSPWVDVLGIRYVLTYWDLPGGKFRLASSVGPRLYENAAAFPKAYFAPAAEAVPDAELDERLRREGAQTLLRTVALAEPEPGTEASSGREAGAVPVKVESYGADEVALSLEAPRPGWVVLTDAWDPGWSARVNGESSAVRRANGDQRAVRVPEGRLDVRFRYRPRGFAASALLSLAAFFAAALGFRLLGSAKGRRR